MIGLTTRVGSFHSPGSLPRPAATIPAPAVSGQPRALPGASSAGLSRQTIDSMLAFTILQLGARTEPGALAHAPDIYAEIARTADSIARAAKSTGISLALDEDALTSYLEAEKPQEFANGVYATAQIDDVRIFTVLAGGVVVIPNEFAWLGEAAGLFQDTEAGGYPPLAQRRLARLVDVLGAALSQSPDGIRGLGTYNVNPMQSARQT